jgi:hypothetical protein
VFEVSDSVRLEAEALSVALGVSSSGPIVPVASPTTPGWWSRRQTTRAERSVQDDRLRIDFELGLGFAEGLLLHRRRQRSTGRAARGQVARPLLIQSVTVALTLQHGR